MKIRSAVIGTLAAIIGIGIVVSVIGSESNDDSERIRVAYFPNIGHAIPIIGIEKGFFEKNLPETSIETKLFDSGPQVIESLFANSIDIAYVGPGPAINGFLNSQDNNLKILGGAASGGASFIMHPQSSDDDFSFDNKKIAAPQIGNTQDVSLRNYLSEQNLNSADKGGSVIVYNIPNPDIYTLFVKNEIDGAWVTEPWATILETELDGERLFYEEDLWPNGQFASVLLIANINYVEKHPKVIERWMAAHTQTVNWINQNPKDTRIVFNEFMVDTFGRGLSDDVVDIALANLEITSDPIKTSVHTFAERADKLGYLGRNGYDLDGIFYDIKSNSELEEISS